MFKLYEIQSNRIVTVPPSIKYLYKYIFRVNILLVTVHKLLALLSKLQTLQTSIYIP